MSTRTLREIERRFLLVDEKHKEIERQYSKFTTVAASKRGHSRQSGHDTATAASYFDDLFTDEMLTRYGTLRPYRDSADATTKRPIAHPRRLKSANAVHGKKHRFWDSIEAVHVDEYRDLIAQQNEILKSHNVPQGQLLESDTTIYPSATHQSEFPVERPVTSLSVTTVATPSSATFRNQRGRNLLDGDESYEIDRSQCDADSPGNNLVELDTYTRTPMAKALAGMRETIHKQILSDLDREWERIVGDGEESVLEEEEEEEKEDSNNHNSAFERPFLARFRLDHIPNPGLWNFTVRFRKRISVERSDDQDDESGDAGVVLHATNAEYDPSTSCLLVAPAEYLQDDKLEEVLAGKVFMAHVFKKEAFPIADEMEFSKRHFGELVQSFLVSFPQSREGVVHVSNDKSYSSDDAMQVSEEILRRPLQTMTSMVNVKEGQTVITEPEYFGMLDLSVYDLPFSPFSDAFKYSCGRISQSRNLDSRASRQPLSHLSSRRWHSHFEHSIPMASELLLEWQGEGNIFHSTTNSSPSRESLTRTIKRLRPMTHFPNTEESRRPRTANVTSGKQIPTFTMEEGDASFDSGVQNLPPTNPQAAQQQELT